MSVPRLVALDVDGAVHRIDDRRELNQRAVAHQLDDAPAMQLDRRIEEFRTQHLQRRQNAFLVRTHHTRVTDDIDHHDCGKLPVGPYLGHNHFP